MLRPRCFGRAKTAAALAAALGLAGIGLAAEPKLRYVQQPPGLENNPRYSHAVVVEEGRLVYVSGQIAHDAEGHLVGRGERAQAKQVFENLKIALKAAGSDMAHVVRLNSYLTDMSQLPAYREVRQQYWGDSPHPPASTLVGVARLVEPEALLEVEAVAVTASTRP